MLFTLDEISCVYYNNIKPCSVRVTAGSGKNARKVVAGDVVWPMTTLTAANRRRHVRAAVRWAIRWWRR